jgi:carboxyl-terminal processing protease
MSRRNLLVAVLVLATAGLLVWSFEAAAEQEAKDAKLFREVDRFVEILRLVQKQYVREVDAKKMFQDAISGMLGGLDPFSNYVPEEDMDEFNKQTRGKFGGIGIQIGMRKGILTVISPLEGTPAYRAGVLAGDIIMEIEGKSTENIRLDQAVKTLTGEPGTKVRLKVRHMTGETAEFTITRELIEVHTVKGVKRDDNNEWVYMLDPEKKIGYIRLTSFVENTTGDLRKATDSLQKDGVKALILDLRFDPGGILKTAVEVCDMFIEKGVIVQTKGRTTPYWEATATKEGTLPYFPMVVLVNQFSASASEILAGCLQDHHRAIVIGERTFGKGSVQNVIPLEGEKAALKLTTSKYYLPSGRNIHRDEDMTEKDEWGVMPDIAVPMTPEEYVAVVRARQEADVMKGPNGAAPPKPGEKPKAQPPKPEATKPEPTKPEPKPEKPKVETPKSEAPKRPAPAAPADLDDDAASPDAAPGAAKSAKPAEDRQLLRALDVLRSIDVIEKYLKHEEPKLEPPRKTEPAKKAA